MAKLAEQTLKNSDDKISVREDSIDSISPDFSKDHTIVEIPRDNNSPHVAISIPDAPGEFSIVIENTPCEECNQKRKLSIS